MPFKDYTPCSNARLHGANHEYVQMFDIWRVITAH